jgi:hypothetical protein
VISTGKSDWAKAVTEVDGTLAAHLLGSESRLHALSPSIPKPTSVSVASKSPNGLFSTAESTRISILNGSHSTIAEDDALHTVLVFPDYKVITGVPSTTEGADHLWRNYVEPGVGRAGAAPLDEAQQQQKSYILPYSCIIQICMWVDSVKGGPFTFTSLDRLSQDQGQPLWRSSDQARTR